MRGDGVDPLRAAQTQMSDRGIDIAQRLRRARGVLPQHVADGVARLIGDRDRLTCYVVRSVKVRCPIVRKIELPQQHRVRGRMEIIQRQAFTSHAGARLVRVGAHGPLQAVLSAHPSILAVGSQPSRIRPLSAH